MVLSKKKRKQLKDKKYRDERDNKYQWTIAGAASKAWAKKVFPNDSEEVAIEKLWDAILMTSRVDGNDPVDNWKKHNEFLIQKRQQLTMYNKYILQ